jgi:hypothetical protein
MRGGRPLLSPQNDVFETLMPLQVDKVQDVLIRRDMSAMPLSNVR